MKNIKSILAAEDLTWKDILIFLLDDDKTREFIENMNEDYAFSEELTQSQIDDMIDYIEEKTREAINLPLMKL